VLTNDYVWTRDTLGWVVGVSELLWFTPGEEHHTAPWLREVDFRKALYLIGVLKQGLLECFVCSRLAGFYVSTELSTNL